MNKIYQIDPCEWDKNWKVIPSNALPYVRQSKQIDANFSPNKPFDYHSTKHAPHTTMEMTLRSSFQQHKYIMIGTYPMDFSSFM